MWEFKNRIQIFYLLILFFNNFLNYTEYVTTSGLTPPLPYNKETEEKSHILCQKYEFHRFYRYISLKETKYSIVKHVGESINKWKLSYDKDV